MLRTTNSRNDNAHMNAWECFGGMFLVARGVFEPPTQGFSIFAPIQPPSQRFDTPRFCYCRLVYYGSLPIQRDGRICGEARGRSTWRYPCFLSKFDVRSGREILLMDRPTTGRSQVHRNGGRDIFLARRLRFIPFFAHTCLKDRQRTIRASGKGFV